MSQIWTIVLDWMALGVFGKRIKGQQPSMISMRVIIFTVQSRYPTGDTSEVVQLNFNVDAVSGPSLMLFPRKHQAFSGETITFKVMAEEVIELSGA